MCQPVENANPCWSIVGHYITFSHYFQIIFWFVQADLLQTYLLAWFCTDFNVSTFQMLLMSIRWGLKCRDQKLQQGNGMRKMSLLMKNLERTYCLSDMQDWSFCFTSLLYICIVQQFIYCICLLCFTYKIFRKYISLFIPCHHVYVFKLSGPYCIHKIKRKLRCISGQF